jgi:hypothetical protein
MSTSPNPPTLSDIMAELFAIRTLLENRAAAAPASAHSAASPAGKFDYKHDDEPIPHPSVAWNLQDAEAHQVHFGKNNGVPLRDLKDTSLSFYAKEKPPQLDRNGKPWPKRPADVDLENAARTVWHVRRGTLGASQPANPSPNASPAPQSPAPAARPARPAQSPAPATAAAGDDEDVPF